MSRFRVALLSALLSASLFGCGVEMEGSEASPNPYEGSLMVESQNPPTAQKENVPSTVDVAHFAKTQVIQPILALQQAPGVTVSASGLSVSDGTTVHAVTAIVGCGYMVMSSGSATAQGGAAIVSLPAPKEDGYGTQVFLFADANGNGTCDSETEAVFQAELPSGTTSVSIDATATPAASWTCMLFNDA